MVEIQLSQLILNLQLEALVLKSPATATLK